MICSSKCTYILWCAVFFSSGYAAFIHHSMLFKCIFWSTCCSSFYFITEQYNKVKQGHLKKWTDHSKLTMGTLKSVCSYLSREIGVNQLEHTLLRVPMTMYLVRTQNSLYLYWDPKFLFSIQIYEKIRCLYIKAEDITHFDTWVNLVNSVPNTKGPSINDVSSEW